MSAEDIPSPIDLRDPGDAHRWVAEADVKRPWRAQFRAAMAEALAAATPPVRRVLELGAGPGLLAERILRTCTLTDYTLLDFSPPMLALARTRAGGYPQAHFVLVDFKQPDWTSAVSGPFDAIVAMQAVHEIRHKRHVPGLYGQLHALLRPAGLLLVCDHTPPDDWRAALHLTEAEQHAAMSAAGFVEPVTLLRHQGLYLCGARRGE